MTAEEWEKKWGSLPQEPIEEKDAEIARLKALLSFAADALGWCNRVTEDLIVELRKAAQ